MGFLARLLRRDQEAPRAATAVGNFQVNATLPNGRGISFSMYLLEGEDLSSINAKLDLCQEAAERQRFRCEIPELEAKREQMVKGMQQAREVLSELETRHKNGESLSSQERMNLKNLQVNIGKMNEEIDKGGEAIREAKLKAGVG